MGKKHKGQKQREVVMESQDLKAFQREELIKK
jgi:hypothetical protein